MKKFGAMLGDEVEVGCGSVLNPGTVVEVTVIFIHFLLCVDLYLPTAFIKSRAK